MKINIGSKNQTKIKAVEEAFGDCKTFDYFEVIPIDIKLKEFGHPKSIGESVDGAISRAKRAFVDCDLSIGIEGGLIAIPKTKTGVMEVAVCVIYDGQTCHIGLSPAFEWPTEVLDKILNEGLDGSQAVKAVGLSSEEKIGTKQGVIGLLTYGRIDRILYNKLAVIMALVHLEHPEYY